MENRNELELTRRAIARGEAAAARAWVVAERVLARLEGIRAEADRRLIRIQGDWTAAERCLRQAGTSRPAGSGHPGWGGPGPAFLASPPRPAGPEAP